MWGEKDRHEAFQEEELQQETRPVEALLHWMLPKQPFIKGEIERKKNNKQKTKKKNTNNFYDQLDVKCNRIIMAK